MWRKWLLGWLKGGPHFIIGPKDNPYVYRWYILPRNRFFNIYLHKFLRDDDDRAFHDHPWASLSVLLFGRYVEETSSGRCLYTPGSVIYRSATYAHRIELNYSKPCWTLFFTGPKVREWGFLCPNGWVHFEAFTKGGEEYGENGRGCGELTHLPGTRTPTYSLQPHHSTHQPHPPIQT